MPGTSPTEPPAEAFARLIRVARAQRNIKRDVVIEQARISKATMSRFEAGQIATPQPAVVTRICRALDIPVTDAFIALGYLEEADLASAA